MIVLGIDPGTATTGYGIIKRSKGEFKCLDYGLIKTEPSLSFEKRLDKLYNHLMRLIKEFGPKILAVEKIYFFKNLKTAISVAQANGVILLAAAKKKIPVCEFTPLQVKMFLTGYGRAEKKEIQKKVKKILKLKELPSDDAADALALTLAYFKKAKG